MRVATLQNLIRLFENYLAQLRLSIFFLLIDAVLGRVVDLPSGVLTFGLTYVPVGPALDLEDAFLHLGLDGPVGIR